MNASINHPDVNSIDYKFIEEIKKEILGTMQVFSRDTIEKQLDTIIAKQESLDLEAKKNLKLGVLNAVFNYDILQPLLDDSTISEIMINGPNQIFLERNGQLEPCVLRFESQSHLQRLVDKIAIEIDRPVNMASPILDAHLKDGSRVNIVIDPVAKDGPILTIRKFGKQLIDLSALIRSGMLSEELSKFLEALVLSKYNLFLCGGTGTGKTTLLNCLGSVIPMQERLITIEDARELNLSHHKNLVSLQTRHGHSGTEPISISSLIKTALRMRPDRIIVGEVRGEEVVDMLQAMNTGHDGSMSTGHSNTARDMLMRLEGIACQNSKMSDLLIRKQIISAIDFIVHIERLEDGRRYISQVCEIDKLKDHYELIVHFDYFEAKTPCVDQIVNRRKIIKHAKA